MTQEEKQLLLTDLCGRLPYDTIISVNNGKYREDVKLHPHYIFDWDAERWDAKPYLRPMSSMTEEERMEFTKLFDKWHDDELFDYIEEGVEFSIWKHKGISAVVFDWLNKKMFDHRGLIPMGLALEATEGMYAIK